MSTSKANRDGGGVDGAMAIVYAAKSTADKHGSIPTQLADGRKLAAQRGFEVVAELQDEAASAYHGDRGPGLARAMAECERLSASHGTSALIVQHSDRLARGDAKQARHLIQVVIWAIQADVQLLSVQDPEMFPEGDMALLLGAIGGMRNHQDSKRKGLAVKSGIKRRAVERKQFIGGRRPFGYRHRDRTEDGRETGPLVIDQAEAAVVRRIFTEYLAGRAQNAIAVDLLHDGVPTLTGGDWYATTVAGMLKNPLYIGQVVHDGAAYPGSHEPIIDQATWDQACELRDGRAAQGRPRGRRTAGRHLLTEGLLRCTCGAAMSPVTKRDRRAANGEGYEVYVCVKRLHHGPSACPEKRLARAVVDGAIFDYFDHVALDRDAMRATVHGQTARDLTETAARQQQAEREAAKAEASLARVERDYLDGKLAVEKWERLEARLLGERDGARAEAEQHDRQREAIEVHKAAIDAEAAVLEELAARRRTITGAIRDGREGDLNELRAALRRLFVGFELASPAARFGSGVLRGQGGQGWVGSDGGKDPLSFDGGYYLLPVLRPEAYDLERDDPAGFPAVRRESLALSDSLCARLAAW